jgi:hypothetical protein
MVLAKCMDALVNDDVACEVNDLHVERNIINVS